MRSYSNLTQLLGRLLVQISQQSLSLRTRICHPHTRTYVRLLGPCFKTGRIKPFGQQLGIGGMWVAAPPRTSTSKPVLARGKQLKLHTGSPKRKPRSSQGSQRRVSHQPQRCYQSRRSFPRARTNVDTQGKIHHARPDQNPLRRLR